MDLKPTVTYDDFAKLDFRVATVLAAEPHPNADRLLKLQIDLGPLGQRQICAGIRAYYQPQDLVGRQIVVIANLEPRRIRGEASNGMLLAASATTPPSSAPAAEPAAAPEPTTEPAAEAQPAAVEPPQILDVVILHPGRPVPPGSSIN